MVNISTVVRGYYVNDEYLWAIIIRRFCDNRSPVARVDSRTQESQRGHNDLSWFGPIDALYLAADDPYT
jgi:hypothetical protein